jgi:hypothetical protein
VIAAVLAIVVPALIWHQTGRIEYAALGLIPAATAPWFVGIPDIDSESSIPRRHLRILVLAVSVLGVGYAAYVNLGMLTGIVAGWISALTPSMSLPLVAGGVLAAGATIGHVMDRKLSDVLPAHREELHNPLLYIGVAALAVAVVHYGLRGAGMARLAAIAVVVSAAFWALVHIAQDKIH